MREERHSYEVLTPRSVSPGAPKTIFRSDSQEYQETSMRTVRCDKKDALTVRVLAPIGL